jgi:hypothetical protein
MVKTFGMFRVFWTSGALGTSNTLEAGKAFGAG